MHRPADVFRDGRVNFSWDSFSFERFRERAPISCLQTNGHDQDLARRRSEDLPRLRRVGGLDVEQRPIAEQAQNEPGSEPSPRFVGKKERIEQRP